MSEIRHDHDIYDINIITCTKSLNNSDVNDKGKLV